jgi:hypothetical protein
MPARPSQKDNRIRPAAFYPGFGMEKSSCHHGIMIVMHQGDMVWPIIPLDSALGFLLGLAVHHVAKHVSV